MAKPFNADLAWADRFFLNRMGNFTFQKAMKTNHANGSAHTLKKLPS